MITKNIKKRNNGNGGIKERIKEYFFTNPSAKLRVRQIERTLSLPLPSVIRYVKELGREGILKIEDISGVVAYSSDRSSSRFLMEKKLFNIKSVFDSGLIDYLVKEHSNPTIILFGSYSKGEDMEKSDIDIYIETPKNQKFELARFEKALNRSIQVFNHKNIKEISNPHLANNIINGIILNGFIEVFK